MATAKTSTWWLEEPGPKAPMHIGACLALADELRTQGEEGRQKFLSFEEQIRQGNYAAFHAAVVDCWRRLQAKRIAEEWTGSSPETGKG